MVGTFMNNIRLDLSIGYKIQSRPDPTRKSPIRMRTPNSLLIIITPNGSNLVWVPCPTHFVVHLGSSFTPSSAQQNKIDQRRKSSQRQNTKVFFKSSEKCNELFYARLGRSFMLSKEYQFKLFFWFAGCDFNHMSSFTMYCKAQLVM